MRVIIGADPFGFALKEIVKVALQAEKFEVVDVSEQADKNFIEATLKVTKALLADETAMGIVFDGYGAGSFMVATKVKGIVAAEVSEERTAYMTREHNNARLITIGAEISGPGIAKNIAREFLSAHYDGGRHQIRVDMLNAMC